MIHNEIKIKGQQITCYEDGSVEWINGRTKKPRRTFGCNSSDGYKIVEVGGRKARVHRLIAGAFLEDFSEDMQVDHINGDKVDNRPDNLRMVTGQQNQRAYRKPTEGTSSKYRGVCLSQQTNKWKAYIRVDGKKQHLGYFEDEAEAALAYDKAAIDLGFAKEALNQTNHGEIAQCI